MIHIFERVCFPKAFNYIVVHVKMFRICKMRVIPEFRFSISTYEELFKIPSNIPNDKGLVKELISVGEFRKCWLAGVLQVGIEFNLKISIHFHFLEELRNFSFEIISRTNVSNSIKNFRCIRPWFLLPELVAGKPENYEIWVLLDKCIYLDVGGCG